jgi:hypothetical protein
MQILERPQIGEIEHRTEIDIERFGALPSELLEQQRARVGNRFRSGHERLWMPVLVAAKDALANGRASHGAGPLQPSPMRPALLGLLIVPCRRYYGVTSQAGTRRREISNEPRTASVAPALRR